MLYFPYVSRLIYEKLGKSRVSLGWKELAGVYQCVSTGSSRWFFYCNGRGYIDKRS